jgi:uncharacterized protein DUF4019
MAADCGRGLSGDVENAKEEVMRILSSNTLLAVLLVLGVTGPSAAQTSTEAPRPNPRGARPSERPKEPAVKITETPSEEVPPAQAQTQAQAQVPAPAPAPQGGAQGREELGITAARDWLSLVDSGNYAASYDQAGEVFRGNTPREQWQAGLENSRRAVGSLVERSLKQAVVAVNLPNAPQGKYVITTFSTKFQQSPQAVWEIVTSFLNPSGQWKVVGYQIKPEGNQAQGSGGGQSQGQPQSQKQ